jgi:hypothetical protein
LWTRQWTFSFHKMLESSRVASQLLAPQEGLTFMKLGVSWHIQNIAGLNLGPRPGNSEISHLLHTKALNARHASSNNLLINALLRHIWEAQGSKESRRSFLPRNSCYNDKFKTFYNTVY